MHSRREVIHFYLSSLLTMQNAYFFAYSVRAPFDDAQCRGGGIYAFVYHCWSQSHGVGAADPVTLTCARGSCVAGHSRSHGPLTSKTAAPYDTCAVLALPDPPAGANHRSGDGRPVANIRRRVLLRSSPSHPLQVFIPTAATVVHGFASRGPGRAGSSPRLPFPLAAVGVATRTSAALALL